LGRQLRRDSSLHTAPSAILKADFGGCSSHQALKHATVRDDTVEGLSNEGVYS
jgi:hypothetical protein